MCGYLQSNREDRGTCSFRWLSTSRGTSDSVGTYLHMVDEVPWSSPSLGPYPHQQMEGSLLDVCRPPHCESHDRRMFLSRAVVSDFFPVLEEVAITKLLKQ